MNSRYTLWSDPAVDAFVQEHLDRIRDELVELMGRDLVAAVLSGGFGRGEGSVFIEDSGDMHIVNDYDIDVIYKNGFNEFVRKLWIHLLYGKKLNSLADQLSAELEIKQIDLSLRSVPSLSVDGPPKLADYDFKYGHRVIYGNAGLIEEIPPIKSSDIPLFEGSWLLRTRGIGLLLAHFYLLENGGVAEEKVEYFYVEVNKAILAMGDALFILRGSYHNAYSVRADRLQEILPEDYAGKSELAELYALASEYKLRPRKLMFEGQSPNALWHRVCRLHVATFLYYESRRLEKRFAVIEDYISVASDAPLPGIARRIRVMFDMLRGAIDWKHAYIAHMKVDPVRSSTLTFLLLAARSEAGVDVERCRLANHLVEKGGDRSWRTLTRDFLLAMHPKGELGRMLRALPDTESR